MYLLSRIWLAIIPVLHLNANSEINLKHGNIIKGSINNSINPCEDFYAYACGNYDEQHPAKSYQEITTYMDLQYNKLVLDLMDKLYQHDHQVYKRCQTFVEKARAYFHACRTESQRNLTKYFEELKPGSQLNWPILEEVESNSSQTEQWPGADIPFDMWSLLGKLQSYGLNNVLINHEILIDRNGEISIMIEPFFIESKNTTLPHKNILYVLLRGLGIKKPAKIIENLNKTDKRLLFILENYGKLNEQSLEMTYGDLEIRFKELTSYVSELLGTELPPDTLILLRKPSYFQHLNFMGHKKLCNYLMMQFLSFLAVDSTADFNNMACIKDLRNKFDLAVNFLFYNYIYAPQAKYIEADIGEMFANLVTTLGKYFKENYLNLSSTQLQLLLDKLSNVGLNIGNLPYQVTYEKVEQFYDQIAPLDRNNYYRNHLLMLKHRFTKSLYYPQNQTHLIATDNMLGSSSGAVYVAKQNMIILPFGSLLMPLYDFRYHDLYKYSLLGFILAHELTHAFDTYSLNFNSQGEPATDEAALAILSNGNFQNSLKCLQSQLTTDSIDEGIADIVAIQVIYKVYTTKCNNLQPSFLDSMWNKYFYLNLAQFFCGKKDLKFIDHDPDALRLNMVIKNSEGFGQAFGCSANSEMNPMEKCRLY